MLGSSRLSLNRGAQRPEHGLAVRAAFQATLLIGAFVSLSACRQSVDLDAARAVAQFADASEASFSAMSSDFYDSCVRENMWNNLRTGGTTTIEADCAPSATSAKQWTNLNIVVLDYFRGLGAVAGNVDDGKSDYGIKSLADTDDRLGSSQTIPDTKSLAGFASGLIKDIESARRRDAIGGDAVLADASLTNLIDALRKISILYGKQLTKERDAIDHYFQPIPPPSGGSQTPTLTYAERQLIGTSKNMEAYALEELRLRQRDEL